jgi:hypothetical protein
MPLECGLLAPQLVIYFQQVGGVPLRSETLIVGNWYPIDQTFLGTLNHQRQPSPWRKLHCDLYILMGLIPNKWCSSLWPSYCIFHVTLPNWFCAFISCHSLKLLYLLQFLTDMPEIWTVHSPICSIYAWYIINPIIVLFQIHIFGFLG